MAPPPPEAPPLAPPMAPPPPLAPSASKTASTKPQAKKEARKPVKEKVEDPQNSLMASLASQLAERRENMAAKEDEGEKETAEERQQRIANEATRRAQIAKERKERQQREKEQEIRDRQEKLLALNKKLGVAPATKATIDHSGAAFIQKIKDGTSAKKRDFQEKLEQHTSILGDRLSTLEKDLTEFTTSYTSAKEELESARSKIAQQQPDSTDIPVEAIEQPTVEKEEPTREKPATATIPSVDKQEVHQIDPTVTEEEQVIDLAYKAMLEIAAIFKDGLEMQIKELEKITLVKILNHINN